MAKELNGTNIVLENGTGAIVGQMEGTLTFNGSPIDISNKSFLDNVTLMDGELAGKQLQFAGSIVYNDDDEYRKVRDDSLTGTQDTYTLTYTGSGTATDESFTALMVPNGLSDTLPHGDKVTTSITFLSSADITHVPAADV